MLQIPSSFVDSLNKRLCELQTISHLPFSVILLDQDTRIFTYYHKDQVEEHFTRQLVNQQAMISKGYDFQPSLKGCENYEKQEFGGGTYLILEEFENSILNTTLILLIVEQNKDVKAGKYIFV